MNEGMQASGTVFYYLWWTKWITMARSTSNILLHQVTGHIGKQIVVKRYGNKTVITAYPDMSRVKPTRLQKAKRKLFANAVAYARAINNDPLKKETYKKKLKKGQSVYNYAIREYMFTRK